MLRIGLTGGIGSGKSTVARLLRRLGALVIDADQVAREIVEPGEPALAAIAEAFGPEILTSEGALDRPAMARIVFNDKERLRVLEGITGPAIMQRVADLRAQAGPGQITVFDMPLLVERRLWPLEHLTIVVDVPAEERVRRLAATRGVPEDDARARIANQASDEERRAAADVIIDNSGAEALLDGMVERLWQERLAPFNDNLVRGRAPERRRVDDESAAARHVERLRAGLFGVGRVGGIRAVAGANPPELVVGLRPGADGGAAVDDAHRDALARAGWIVGELDDERPDAAYGDPGSTAVLTTAVDVDA